VIAEKNAKAKKCQTIDVGYWVNARVVESELENRNAQKI